MVDLFLVRLRALDARLLRVARPLQYAAIAGTVLVMVAACLPHVPRTYVSYAGIPVLERLPQPETHGPDTIGAIYAAKVVLNDVGDMYARELVEQTPLERATWSKEASAPYPPAMLLAFAGLYAVGAWSGIEYYGTILILAAAFLALSAWYCLQTRWYLFPVLYLNFSYFGHRFTYVQDGSYLVMLVVVMIALVLARQGWRGSHVLMAAAIVLKLSPLAYVKHLAALPRRTALLSAAIVFAGLALPVFVWEKYLDIFLFHQDIKGNVWDTLAAVVVVVPLTALLWYVEGRRGFDLEDRIGWALVPFAMFIGIKMRVARHLLIVLLVPDKRGPRTLIAALGLGLHEVAPELFRLGSVLYITSVLLIATLVWHLRAIGWETVQADAARLWLRMRTLALAPGERAA